MSLPPESSPFGYNKLNDTGIDYTIRVQIAFDEVFAALKKVIPKEGSERESALVLTNLQTASFWAKKAVAKNPKFQTKE